MVYAVAALLLAVVAGVQPTAFVRSVGLLDRPPPGRTLAWRFAIGLGITLFAVALLAAVGSIVFIRGGTARPTTELDSSDVVLGGIALVSGLVMVAMARLRRGNVVLPVEMPQDAPSGPLAGVGLGMRTMAGSIAPLALYIAAVSEIVSIQGLWGLATVLLVAVTMLVLAAGLLAPSLDALAPERADGLLPRLHAWARTSGPVTAGLLSTLAGAGLVIRGLLG